MEQWPCQKARRVLEDHRQRGSAPTESSEQGSRSLQVQGMRPRPEWLFPLCKSDVEAGWGPVVPGVNAATETPTCGNAGGG